MDRYKWRYREVVSLVKKTLVEITKSQFSLMAEPGRMNRDVPHWLFYPALASEKAKVNIWMQKSC